MEKECENCEGTGIIDELGDGEHFEVDVIGHKECTECEGTGYIIKANGSDDYDLEVCTGK